MTTQQPELRVVAVNAPVGIDVRYVPVLDMTRGTIAGYHAEIRPRPGVVVDDITQDSDGRVTAELIDAALVAAKALPANTFLAIPVPVQVAASRRVLNALLSRPRLDGVVIELLGSIFASKTADLVAAVTRYREAGAEIAVGGYGTARPELGGIVRMQPTMLFLARDWVRGIDTSTDNVTSVEIACRIAQQLNARVLVEGVCSAAELRALANLGVRLAQGPFIGTPQRHFASIDETVKSALPRVRIADDATAAADPLLQLVQPAYSTTDAAVAVAVLSETRGFDVVVIVDDQGRPTKLLEYSGSDGWLTSNAFAVDIAMEPVDVARRAITRPRDNRFSPVACTDDDGKFIGIIRMETLVTHLAGD